MEVPRVPQLHFRIEKERYIEKIRLDEDPKAKRRGRGRARVRQHLTDNKITTVGQPQVTVPSSVPITTSAVPTNLGPPINTGGFGRPSWSSNHHSHNDHIEFSNIQPPRRGFSIEDFISESSSRKKKRNNKSAAAFTIQLPNSVEETEESSKASSDNNESVVMSQASLESAGSVKQIDGYLLSKMLNIPCTGGEKIINTDSSVLGSITSSISALNDVYKFEYAMHIPPKKNKKGGKVPSSKEKSEEEDGWVLNGENVVEICDLPGDCDVSLLQDIIAAYGAIIESDVISSGSAVSVRYQLDSSEATDWVVSNLDNADYLFEGHCVKCRRVT